jgi:hypothetical protein
VTRKMPAIAAWLLNRFGVPQSNESLMGDLVEESGSGRSALWFWRETIVAIADSVARNLRDHKVLAVRAIATGWLMNLAWGQVLGLASRHELWRRHLGLYDALLLSSFVAWPAMVGWVVARTHRAQQASMVLAYAASLAIVAIWALSVHYSQMKACVECTPDLWDTNLTIDCLLVLLTLIGGLLPRPRLKAV